MLSTRNTWRSTDAITSPTAAPCRAKLVLPIKALLPYILQTNEDSRILPTFPRTYAINTAVFLMLSRTHIQMTRATHCFILRWRLRLLFCCYDTQMSSAKVFKKSDLLKPNFNHQWAVWVIILSHQSMPVSCHFTSPSNLLQISVVKNTNNIWFHPFLFHLLQWLQRLSIPLEQ